MKPKLSLGFCRACGHEGEIAITRKGWGERFFVVKCSHCNRQTYERSEDDLRYAIQNWNDGYAFPRFGEEAAR